MSVYVISRDSIAIRVYKKSQAAIDFATQTVKGWAQETNSEHAVQTWPGGAKVYVIGNDVNEALYVTEMKLH